MDRETMRKRGWSIQSDQTSHSDKHEPEGQAAAADGHLDDTEKMALLQSFPVEAVHDSDIHGNENGDMVHSSHPPAAKRRKTGDPSLDALTHGRVPETDANDKEERVEVAKKKLSKWAARLFDPDRPRGLVQPPQTIPLNDEFLAAFGKREKEYDDKLGRKIDIAQEIKDDIDSSDEEEKRDTDDDTSKAKKVSIEGRKVKIVNLAYTTTEDTLEAACHKFGPVEHVNLLMDKEKADLNVGRAYVTFETTQSADACVDGLQTLDGRQLRTSIAEESNRSRRSAGGSTSRYWIKDISTKCFRCGQVGHMADACLNAAVVKPCPLCGGFDHDMRACPKSRVCFRCGVPGHINRECAYRQNLPKRVVCGICFQSGHHRCSCRRRAHDAPSQDAKCFVCHKRGHFMCREMKWFFGLDSMTCFNCGRNGHSGYDCDRPGVDLCARDDELADREIDRAEAVSLADEVEQQSRNRGRERGRDRAHDDGDRSRAKSQPHFRQFRSSRDDRGYPQQQIDRLHLSNGGRGSRGSDTSRGRSRR